MEIVLRHKNELAFRLVDLKLRQPLSEYYFNPCGNSGQLVLRQTNFNIDLAKMKRPTNWLTLFVKLTVYLQEVKWIESRQEA